MTTHGRWTSLLLVLLVAPEFARAGSLVFDFETGLQGWTLGPGSQRVSGSPLGGDFAIFGEEASMGTELDLTAYGSITFSQLQTSTAPVRDNFLLFFIRPIPNPDPGGPVWWETGQSLVATSEDPSPNPDTRTIDLTGRTGPHSISIGWSIDNSIPSAGFVDDIIFQAVPEPAPVLFLLVAGALCVRRRDQSA